MLDQRVAHGKAELSIGDLAEFGFASSGAMARYLQMMKSGGVAETAKGARRKVRDFLPMISRHWMLVHQGDHKKYGPFLSGMALEAFEEGKRYFGFSQSPGSCLFLMRYRFGFMRGAAVFNHATPVALFSLHAIARNHQRDVVKEKAELAEDIVSTITSLWLMQYVSRIFPETRQVFAKTRGGLYLGSLDRGSELDSTIFKTFVNIENLQPKYRAAIAALIDVGLDRFDQRAYAEMVCGEPAVVTDVEHEIIKAVFGSSKMDWMREEYEARRTKDQCEKSTEQNETT